MSDRPEGSSRPKSVLFVAYHYPPIASGGVERTLKFVQYLPEFGYEPTVLTTSAFSPSHSLGPDEALRAWEPLRTYRFLFDRDTRVGYPQLSSKRTVSALSPLIARLRRWLFVPDGQITWAPAAFAKALRFMRSTNVDLIYTTSPPASAHIVGLLLKQQSGLPWVADFRDSWIYDPLDPELMAMPCRREFERRLEKRVVMAADAVVATTDVSAAYLRDAYPGMGKSVDIIPNGFDPADAESEGPISEALVQDGVRQGVSTGAICTAIPSAAGPMPMRIVHTGSFSASHPQRSPVPMFRALETLIDRNAQWRTRLRLDLVGNLTASEREAAKFLLTAGVAEIHGEVDRLSALEFQRRADVLLLVDHPRAWASSNVPGKFFEYAATGHPILALCGDGMVAQMLHRLQCGIQVSLDNVTGICEALEQLYREHRSGTARGANLVHLRPFHRRELTRNLAACFDRVL